MDAGALGIDGYGDGHVDYFELVDGFHAEVGEGEDFGALDGLGNEVRRAAYCGEKDGLELADGGDGDGAAFGLADHAEEAGFGEHLAGELVHAGGGGGAGGADNLVADGHDGADVVDEAIFEIYGQALPARKHVGEALVGGVAAGEEFAGEEDDFSGLPGADVVAGDGVQVDAAGVLRGVVELGPGVERGGRDHDGAAAVEMDVEVAGGGAVGDHGYWEICRVSGEVLDLDVEDGGEAAEALCSDA